MKKRYLATFVGEDVDDVLFVNFEAESQSEAIEKAKKLNIENYILDTNMVYPNDIPTENKVTKCLEEIGSLISNLKG